MKQQPSVHISILEDDQFFNSILTQHVTSICQDRFQSQFDVSIASYSSAHTFIDTNLSDIDYLLLDYYLYDSTVPEQINGYDVIKRLKKQSPKCKMILLSALSDPLKLRKIQEMGIIAHVNKSAFSKTKVGSILQAAIEEDYSTAHS